MIWNRKVQPLVQGTVREVLLHVPHGCRIHQRNEQSQPPGHMTVVDEFVEIAGPILIRRNALAPLLQREGNHDPVQTAAFEDVVDGLEFLTVADVIGAADHWNKGWTEGRLEAVLALQISLFLLCNSIISTRFAP